MMDLVSDMSVLAMDKCLVRVINNCHRPICLTNKTSCVPKNVYM